jgi:hypothetical protein
MVLQSVFYCHAFCTHRTCSTLLFALELNYFLADKSKNQRAAPTAQNKKTRQKKLTEAKLHNVVL